MPYNIFDLISVIKQLGYPAEEKGVCWGVTMEAIEMCASERSFNDFNRWLALIYNQEINFVARLSALKNRVLTEYNHRPFKPNEEECLINEAHTFLANVSVYQDPSLYREYFDNRCISQTNSYRASKVVGSDKIVENGGLIKFTPQTRNFTRDQLEAYINALIEVADKHHCNIPLQIGSSLHTVCLCYDANIQTWVYVDTTRLPARPLVRTRVYAIVNEMFESLRGNDELTITNIFYTIKNNQPQVQKFLDDLAQHPQFIKAQPTEISPFAAERMVLCAARYGDTDTLKKIYSSASKKFDPRLKGFTPLHFAAQEAQIEAIQVLIDAGVDLNANDSRNIKPIHCAIVAGDIEVIELLAKNGADLNQVDKDGFSAAHYVLNSLYQPEVLEKLIELKANVNISGKQSIGFLREMAKKGGFAARMECLIRFDNKLQNDFTPYKLALVRNFEDILKVFHEKTDQGREYYNLYNRFLSQEFHLWKENIKFLKAYLRHELKELTESWSLCKSKQIKIKNRKLEALSELEKTTNFDELVKLAYNILYDKEAMSGWTSRVHKMCKMIVAGEPAENFAREIALVHEVPPLAAVRLLR